MMHGHERFDLDVELAFWHGWRWDDTKAHSPSGASCDNRASREWWWLPHYFTSMDAAFELVHELISRQKYVSLDYDSGQWFFYIDHHYSHPSRTASEAICRSVLKFVKGKR